MNRQVEFRGKLLHSGEWVFGSLIKIDSKYHIVTESDMYEDGHHIRQESDTPTWVDEDTVGQFTGLRDKNGRKIYEGDIISFVDGLKQVNGEWIDNEHIYSVEYSEASFKGVCGLSKCLDAVEVIGNIYDNQDLLYKK